MNNQLITAALAAFGPGAIAEYVSSRQVLLGKFFLARFLPPVPSTDADIANGNVRVLAGLAGVTAPDSPYAKVAGLKTQLNENSTFKTTAETTLTERDQKILSSRVVSAILGGGNQTGQEVVQSYIAQVFEDGVMLSLDNKQEQMRAVALATGEIKGEEGGNKLNISYGVEAQFKPAKRKGAQGYGGASSKFWDDVDGARTLLLGGEPNYITDPTTFGVIMGNSANGALVLEREVVSDWLTRVVLTQGTKLASGEWDTSRPTLDYRRRVQLWIYSGYAENPDGSRVQFWPAGHMTALLMGSQTVNIIDGQVVSGALGVTHIGPTWELGGASRRYGKIFKPEDAEYEVQFKGAENILPDLKDNRRAVFYSTELP